MKKAIIGLAALVAGCTAGITGENTTRLCSGAKVEFMDYGFKAVKGDSEFIHIESYSGQGITMEVPDGCNNILNMKNKGNLSTYEDNGCNGSVDLFYREFRRSRREPMVQSPAESVEATRYYSEFFSMDIPGAQRLWEEWKQNGGN